jgi:predicted RNA-binding Zn-ribbon protein involved in translation (DUF1610 family)
MRHETLIKATFTGSLAWQEHEERAVDRVTAIGFAGRGRDARMAAQKDFGVTMLRVEAQDPMAMRKIILLVVRRLNHKFRITRGFAEKIAFAVMHEYLRTNCPACGGKAEIRQKGGVTLICPQCNGSGLHRYSDMDRARLVGGGYNKAAHENALAYVRDSLNDVVVNINKRLEED